MAIFEKHSDISKIKSSIYIKKCNNENKTQINTTKKNNCYNIKTYSTKSINLFKAHQFDNLMNSADIETHRKKNNKLTENIQQDLLYRKLPVFFDKNKFKLSNKYDAKNSKYFLKKKDKCLEKINLSDTIDTYEKKCNSKTKNKRKKNMTQKSLHHYYIIVSNYDEEIRNHNSQKKLYVKQTKI